MIYLIGGSPRGGKSQLSRMLSKKLNIPYISTDNIRPLISPYFTKEQQQKILPFEEMFNIDKIDQYFEKYSGKEILKADIVEAKTLWLGIDHLIKYLLICKMDYILEGVVLLPKLTQNFKDCPNIKIK